MVEVILIQTQKKTVAIIKMRGNKSTNYNCISKFRKVFSTEKGILNANLFVRCCKDVAEFKITP